MTGRLRATLTTVLDQAEHAGAATVIIENRDFADARVTGRETTGHGKRGKRFRRTVAGIPTAYVHRAANTTIEALTARGDAAHSGEIVGGR